MSMAFAIPKRRSRAIWVDAPSVELIRPHVREVRHAAGEREERGDRAHVPDVVVAEARRVMAAKSASPISWASRETFIAKSSSAFWRAVIRLAV
jgi:hypothetical protein